MLTADRLSGEKLRAELAENGIPFSIENMDVMDTPDVRDLLASAADLGKAAD